MIMNESRIFFYQKHVSQYDNFHTCLSLVLSVTPGAMIKNRYIQVEKICKHFFITVHIFESNISIFLIYKDIASYIHISAP